MKNVITVVLILAGIYLIWYFTSRPSVTVSPVVPDSSGSDLSSGGVLLPGVINQPKIELDHSDEGFMYLPVNSSGDVVPQQFATHVIKVQNQGDCAYNYRNFVILRIKPKPEPPVEA